MSVENLKSGDKVIYGYNYLQFLHIDSKGRVHYKDLIRNYTGVYELDTFDFFCRMAEVPTKESLKELLESNLDDFKTNLKRWEDHCKNLRYVVSNIEEHLNQLDSEA